MEDGEPGIRISELLSANYDMQPAAWALPAFLKQNQQRADKNVRRYATRVSNLRRKTR